MTEEQIIALMATILYQSSYFNYPNEAIKAATELYNLAMDNA